MIYAVADTHALIWYLLANPNLSYTAKQQFDLAAKNKMYIGISTISIVEMIYLMEKERISPKSLTILNEELSTSETVLSLVPLDYKISQTLKRVMRDQIPDMPDRIIAATALFHNVPLISRDKQITLSDIETVW